MYMYIFQSFLYKVIFSKSNAHTRPISKRLPSLKTTSSQDLCQQIFLCVCFLKTAIQAEILQKPKADMKSRESKQGCRGYTQRKSSWSDCYVEHHEQSKHF